jgi:hypothetical protein
MLRRSDHFLALRAPPWIAVGAISWSLLGGCEVASAACDPQAASNVNATCTGTTNNQAGGAPGTSAGINGYGTGAETGLAVTVVPGASVAGTIAGINFTTGTVTNSGTITGGVIGISAFSSPIATATVINSGTITGGNFGIDATTAIVTNSGTISGSSFGIASTNTTVTNSGTISGGNFGIAANSTATVTNFGTISGGSGTGFGIDATTAIVTNFGTISGVHRGVQANGTAIVTNFGSISGGNFGVTGNAATVINFGTISSGGFGVGGGATATVTNSGTISGSIFGVQGGVVTVTNSGTISGGTAIQAFSPSTLVNSGTVVGTGGTAIDFSASNSDSLTFLAGSRVIGAINLGTQDTINFGSGNHNLTFNSLAGATVTGTIPFAVSGNQAAAIDPTPFAAAGALLTDFTRSVSSLVPMFAEATPVASGAALSFAAPAAGSPMEATFSGIPGLSAYASDRAVFKSPKVLYADGTAIWAGGFAGGRIQQADGELLRNTNRYYGGALGGEKQVRPDLRLGAFIGAGSTRSSIDFNYGGTDSDLAFAGAFARYLSGAWFAQAGLQGGISRNSSTRNINNNLVPGGIETATARYDGWYLSPEATIGQRLALGQFQGAQHSLTPSVQVRYLHGSFGGYTETGSTANLTVGTRTVENFEERAELKLTRTQPLSATSVFLIDLTGGALGVQRVGGDTINAALLGQAMPFATPGKADVWGGFGGAGIELRNGSVTVFAAGEYLALSNSSAVVSGKGGVRLAF